MDQTARAVPLPVLSPSGRWWLGVLVLEGWRVRLIAICYTCEHCDGWHLYNGF